MKNILLMLLLIFSPVLVYADMGSCYCIKAEIVTKQNIEEHGYFSLLMDLNIQQEDEVLTYHIGQQKGTIAVDRVTTGGYILSVDNAEFFKVVRSILYDSILLHEDVVFLKASGQTDEVQGFAGSRIQIASADIISFRIKAVQGCTVGVGIRTRLSVDDKSWIDSGKVKEVLSVGAAEACSYTLMIFEDLPEEAIYYIEELKHYIEQERLQLVHHQKYSTGERKDNQDKINALLEMLRKYKALMISECAC